jgi:transposase
MKQLTPEIKHSILTHYTSPLNNNTLDQILSLHDISVTRQTVYNWLNKWNGTIESLQHEVGAGRPHILTKQEEYNYITAPIRRMNRSYKQVKYTKIANQVREKTGKNITDRTIRLIGKSKLGAKKTRGKKRTLEESKYKYMYNE